MLDWVGFRSLWIQHMAKLSPKTIILCWTTHYPTIHTSTNLHGVYTLSSIQTCNQTVCVPFPNIIQPCDMGRGPVFGIRLCSPWWCLVQHFWVLKANFHVGFSWALTNVYTTHGRIIPKNNCFVSNQTSPYTIDLYKVTWNLYAVSYTNLQSNGLWPPSYIKLSKNKNLIILTW